MTPREHLWDAPIQLADERPQFHGIDYFSFGPLDIVLTTLDRDCDDFVHLIGQTVTVDDVKFRCRSAQYAFAGPPYKKGRQVTLWIDRPQE